MGLDGFEVVLPSGFLVLGVRLLPVVAEVRLNE